MVASTAHLPDGAEINVVCNQYYHGDQPDDDRKQCQRMMQSAATASSGNITIILDFPRQPASVRLAAKKQKSGSVAGG